jgi:hypothetical protein
MLHGLVLWCLPRETASTTGRWSLCDVARLINVAGEGEHASSSPDPDQAKNGGMAIQVHCHDLCCANSLLQEAEYQLQQFFRVQHRGARSDHPDPKYHAPVFPISLSQLTHNAREIFSAKDLSRGR